MLDKQFFPTLQIWVQKWRNMLLRMAIDCFVIVPVNLCELKLVLVLNVKSRAFYLRGWGIGWINRVAQSRVVWFNKCHNIYVQWWCLVMVTFFDSQPTLTVSFQDAVQSIPFLEGSFNLKLKFSHVLRKSIV